MANPRRCGLCKQRGCPGAPEKGGECPERRKHAPAKPRKVITPSTIAEQLARLSRSDRDLHLAFGALIWSAADGDEEAVRECGLRLAQGRDAFVRFAGRG